MSNYINAIRVLCLIFLCLMPTLSFTARAGSDRGDFVPVWIEVTNPAYREIQTILQKEKALELLAKDLNETVKLPMDIVLTFGECQVANAFYDPKEKVVVICYELLERFATLFAPEMESEEELGEAILGATLFVFYHEIGHALVDVLQLPITGKEEDAVDQLSATILLAPGEDNGAASTLDAAFWFLRESEESHAQSIADLPFYGEHSMNPTRFYNLICWVYGSNPALFGWLVEDGVLPPERAGRCGDELKRFSSSWDRIMAEHFK